MDPSENAPPRRKFVGLKNKNNNNSDDHQPPQTAQGTTSEENSQALVSKKKPNVKVFKGKSANQIPASISENEELKEMIKLLPSNYNFEIVKSVWRIQEKKAKKIALQFPEGLLVYSCIISDILEKFCQVETIIMGDVTYGACCVDDYSAFALGCDFMIHYGHSCLVPIDQCSIPIMYVFVDIKFDLGHFIETVKQNFPKDSKICMVGTIQFTSSLPLVKKFLEKDFNIFVPQERPLSPGEVLGCTSPKVPKDCDLLIYLGDGRFHLESVMISNPELKAYKYDPYSKKITLEEYGHTDMQEIRKKSISQAQKAQQWGIILGTLGRQGRPRIVRRLAQLIQEQNKNFSVVLLSEIFPNKLKCFPQIDAWVQIACPRLSIDWGYAFERPLLSPYEAEVALGGIEWKEIYPMDFYSKNGGSWTNYYNDEGK